MKRTGIDHPKTKRLAKLLDVAHFAAVGILECVWHFTARHAICGDIGRWKDEEIADAVGWPADDAARLVSVLVDAGWLDRCQPHRLVVHDWSDHCDESTKKTVQRKGWQFAKAFGVAKTEEACRDLSRHVEKSSAVVATCLDSQSQSQSRSQSQSLFLSPKGENEKGLPTESLKSDSEKLSTKASTSAKDKPLSHAELLYLAYPRKVGKADALRAINAALKVETYETLLEAVQAFAASPKASSQFCPHPATWFKHERWNDDRNEWQRPDSGGRGDTRSRGPVIGPGQIHDPNANYSPL